MTYFFNRTTLRGLTFFIGMGAPCCGYLSVDEMDTPSGTAAGDADTYTDDQSTLDPEIDFDNDIDSASDEAAASNDVEDTSLSTDGTTTDTGSDEPTEPGAGADTDADTETDADGDTDVHTETDADGDTDVHTETDADGDTDVHTETDADGDTDADSDTDSDSHTGSDSVLSRPPSIIDEVSDPETKEANPSFTGDRLELYFNSMRADAVGSSDIFVSKRESTAAPWGSPALVAELSTPHKDSTPKVSSNGLFLWFSSDRDGCVGELDIWVSTRPTREDPWGPPVCASELSSPEADSGASVDASMLTLVLTSERSGSQNADLYWTIRPSLKDPWPAPALIPGLETSEDDADPQLIRGGLELYFASNGRARSTNLYVATRDSLREDFGAPEPLTDLNSESEETGPWLSEDGHYIIFCSNRTGNGDLYEASR